MIISHKYKFIFIRVPKTASTSIQFALGKICGPKDIVTYFKEQIPGHKSRNYEGFGPHTPARKIKREIKPEIWNNYFKFAFERNPFDKMISSYSRKTSIDHYQGSFKQFCLDCSEGKWNFPLGFRMYTIKGELSVDFIGKYETLNSDFEFVRNKLGLPPMELTHEKGDYRKDKSHYSTFYDDESRKIVEKHYSREINFFGYKFEKL